MHDADFDLVIVGSGLVGLSLACALRDSGLRLALVDRAPVPAGGPDAAAPEDWDARVYAISPGSEAFLAACEAWPDATQRIAPVHSMDIFGDAAGRLVFTAQQAHARRLASIVEGRLLLKALWDRVQSQREIEILVPAGARALRFDPDQACLELDTGKQVHARLIVAADGAGSWVREQAGVKARATPYGQSAVVANFACTHPHQSSAFQWFHATGVLALLPLPGERCSMVWSAAQALADELMSLAPQALCTRVEKASHRVLGALRQITPAAAFPLQLVRVERMVASRLALVGDAAHNLHPLAGQGVNIGFSDARELARVLRQRGACGDAGEYRLLRRYERARREDVLAMTLVTDGLQRLFNNDNRPLAWLRNCGLGLVERSRPLKHLLARHALG